MYKGVQLCIWYVYVLILNVYRCATLAKVQVLKEYMCCAINSEGISYCIVCVCVCVCVCVDRRCNSRVLC